MSTASLARALDLAGIFAFALSGASLAVRRGFDVVGILVLALATGLGGGVVRDLMVGVRPPSALDDELYLAVPLAATALALAAHGLIERWARPVLLLDAAGLGLFSVAGATVALEADLGPGAVVLLGTVTAVGGGVIRDVLAREVPAVFRPETGLYAIPAALGALAVVAADRAGAFGPAAASAIAAGVVALRLLAHRRGWRAPVARGDHRPPP